MPETPAAASPLWSSLPSTGRTSCAGCWRRSRTRACHACWSTWTGRVVTPTAAACRPARNLAQGVRWAETELSFSEENRGSWTQAHLVNQVLQRYPWAIFLEDDCLPVPGFYDFMRRALEHYAGRAAGLLNWRLPAPTAGVLPGLPLLFGQRGPFYRLGLGNLARTLAGGLAILRGLPEAV